MLLRVRRSLLLLLALLPAPGFAADKPAPELTVFAASSLTNALQDIGDAYTKETGAHVRFSFAASSTLARQIESGADAHIFFPADTEWMNYLQNRGLINKQSRRDVLGNQLVLIAPADSKIQLKIEPKLDKGRVAVKLNVGATTDEDKLKLLKALEESKSFSQVQVQIERTPTQPGGDRTVLELTAVYSKI